MTSRYTVVQFVPDPLADERINIGVITWDGMGAHARFVENWDRARRFGGGDVHALREFATSLGQRLATSSDLLTGETNSQFVEKMVAEWGRTIQMTPARGSLEAADDLMTRLVPQYLHEAPTQPRPGRDRRGAAADVYGILKGAVEQQRPNDVDRLVHRRHAVKGRLNEHRFDVVLANGKAIAAVDALSFEVGTPGTLQRDVDAVAWALDDVIKEAGELSLAVFALRPRAAAARPVFDGAALTYAGLGAEFIDDARAMHRWSHAQADRMNVA